MSALRGEMFATLTVLLFVGGPAAAAGKKPAAVVYLTQGAAFLNRGAADGVQVGSTVKLWHKEKPSGTCQVTTVAAHYASCTPQGGRVGDTFAVAPPAPKPPSTPRLAVVVPVKDATERIAHSEFPLVEFRGLTSSPIFTQFPVELTLSHTTWTLGIPNSTYSLESIDLNIGGIPLGFFGMRVFANASLWIWSNRPTTNVYRPTTSVMVFVRDLEISTRDASHDLTFAVGRIQPYHVPGVWMLDGLQVGYKVTARSEVGVYGGALPDPFTLSPSTANWAAGVYGSLGLVPTREVQIWQDLRLGVGRPEVLSNNTPTDVVRAEVEWRGNVKLTQMFDLSGDVRGALPLDGSTPAYLDGANANLRFQPVPSFRVDGAFQYLSPLSPYSLAILPQGALTLGARHAYADVGFSGLGFFDIAVTAGYSNDLSGLTQERFWVGPEVSLPNLAGGHLTLSASYDQFFGPEHGGAGYIQAVISPVGYLHFLLRASYVEYGLNGENFYAEGGGYVHAELEVNKHLSFRVSGLVRTVGDTTGLNVFGAVAGRL